MVKPRLLFIVYIVYNAQLLFIVFNAQVGVDGIFPSVFRYTSTTSSESGTTYRIRAERRLVS